MKLKSILERMLLKLVSSGEMETGEGDDRVGHLTEMIEERDRLLQAMRETDRRRSKVHRKLKDRYQKSKSELTEVRRVYKRMRKDVNDMEAKLRYLHSEYDKLIIEQQARLSRPGLWEKKSVLISRQSLRGNFLNWRQRVWKYTMRLGVLHQYTPKPRWVEPLPGSKAQARREDWPVISVVTPSYQQAEFIERTLQSVLGQKYSNLEYFVMDAASTDGSVEIIQRYAPELADWVSEKDSGPADAINKGFKKSKGEIMAWLNSDDVWMPGILSCVAQYFVDHPDVDVVYGHRIMIDERDNQVGHWTMPPHDPEMLLWNDYIPQETMFWRRDLWDRVGGQLDESYKFAFDWELLLRFQRAGAKMVRLPYYTGCFRVHEAQKSSALISTTGFQEMARLRERELGNALSVNSLENRVVAFQGRAIFYDLLMRMGIRR